VTKIRIRNLNAWYGNQHVLKNLNLDIPDKSITVIIGPSGCGKTTLLRVINRLHETIPEARVEGEVFIDNVNIYSDKVNPVEVRRKVGMIFQHPIVFPHLSIYENVAIGLILNGYKDKAFVRDRVVDSLKEAGLWKEVKDRLDERATGLSGGQRQRLAIARAIALRPEILLMDEPTSALDPSSTARIESLITRLKKNYTIVLVTHFIQQAARVADYIAFLYEGRLIEYGPADEILERPKEKLTEKYLVGEF
jgi:phosphate transport system ATP-binding protein